MKQLALEVVARTLDPEQISHLAEEFDHADNNNNGEVSARARTNASNRIWSWLTRDALVELR